MKNIELREARGSLRVVVDGVVINDLMIDLKTVRNALRTKMISKGTIMYDNMIKNIKIKLADENLTASEVASTVKSIEEKFDG